MHYLLLVVTDEFPSYDDIALKMFPWGEPSNDPNGLKHYEGRFELEQDFMLDAEDALGREYYPEIERIDGPRDFPDESEIRERVKDEYDLLVNKDFPMTLEKMYTSSKGYQYKVTIKRTYDLSAGIVAAVRKIGYVELAPDYQFYGWLEATDQNIFERMLEEGLRGAVIAVDNKLQFYRLVGFEGIWDWWVIGGRWTHYLMCDINGRANATRCSELNLDVMKRGELTYAVGTLSQLFRLTVDEFEWATRFNDLDEIIHQFALAVHEYHYLKKLIVEYNGDIDPFDYKQDMKSFKLMPEKILASTSRIQEWFLRVVNETRVKPGELSMLHFNNAKSELSGCFLAGLGYRLNRKIGLNHSFLYSKEEPVDNVRAVKLTGAFNDYIECMPRPVFIGNNILLDNVMYDPWGSGVMRFDDKVRETYIPIDNIDEKHLKYFDFENQNSVYYAAIVELPEGRSIPWHMFIEGLLGHPEMQSKFVTVVDYHS